MQPLGDWYVSQPLNKLYSDLYQERNAVTATDAVGRYLYVDQLLSSYINIVLLCTYRSELLQIPELRNHVMKSARGSIGLLIQMTKVELDSTFQTWYA